MGIGFEATLQLARSKQFSKLIITSRTEKSAKASIQKLAASSGEPESLFDFVLLDLVLPESCAKAAASLPQGIDVFIMNAGQISDINALTADKRCTVMYQEMVLGHSIIITSLLADGKIKKGGRVVFSGSEATRNVWLFSGFQPFVFYKHDLIKEYPLKPPGGCISVRAELNAYGNAKLAGTLFLTKLAKENPDIYFVTVSPGGVKTTIYDGFAQPMRCLIQNCAPIFECVNAIHRVELGAKRYVDAALEADFPTKFPSGSFAASPICCPFYLGAAGPLTNQNKYSTKYEDEKLIEETARVVRCEMAKITPMER
jgi:NAD(P)-dependent dehydrogenase (short-subunit alcohol dehydrogenase family)